MNESNNYWNQLYESRNNQKPVYDLWLDKYAAILSTSNSIPIIDLGCGSGNNTLYLQERNYKVISCDFSKEALKKLDFFIHHCVCFIFLCRFKTIFFIKFYQRF